ncbi:MAG TPA: hypothetical protein VMT58_05795 [Candidatus Binataceae bacterium]|nr:hypothetical protein [Candidatus Binataceae bacterium]
MSSDSQIVANQLNARKSSGPRSARGKARSASNAIKHGLAAVRAMLPEEDPVEFGVWRSALIAALAPVGALEEIFAEKIVTDAWRIRRIPGLEAALHRRAQREGLIEAARDEVASFRPSPLDSIKDLMPIPAYLRVAPENAKAHEAAKARLENLLERPEDAAVRATRAWLDYAATFSSLERYETALSRSVSRALHELQRLQGVRTGERVAPPIAVDVDVASR